MNRYGLALLILGTILHAQAPPSQPVVNSPEVLPDHRIVFRILAPQAKAVTLRAGDIPKAALDAAVFAKDDEGIWSSTTGPVIPGAYRYLFNIDGIPTADPRNPTVSESNANTWSQVNVPGSDFMDVQNVPHGSVAVVHYYSKSLERDRRMHIYTPPGYGTGNSKYPVLYLLHGNSDSDDGWTSVGRAAVILDNLLAAKKARPMIIVMPAGHTSMEPRSATAGARDEFQEDFVNDIMPYVGKNYRVFTDRAHTAIAGLSMGGRQTMNIAMAHLDRFGYIGVFSSGVFGTRRPGTAVPAVPARNFEEQNSATLDNAGLKRGLKLLWISTGAEDAAMANTKQTVEMLKKHGFAPVFHESPGGHTWINWRNYLNEFAPLLF